MRYTILAHQIRISTVFAYMRKFYLTYPILIRGKKAWTTTLWPHVDPWRHRNVKIRHHVKCMSHLALFRIFGGLFPCFFFQYKMGYLVVSKIKYPYFVWGWYRKTRPLGSPLVITRQALWCQSVILDMGFLFHFHTRDGFFYYHMSWRKLLIFKTLQKGTRESLVSATNVYAEIWSKDQMSEKR